MRKNYRLITIKPKATIVCNILETTNSTYMAICYSLNLTLEDDTIEELKKTVDEGMKLLVLSLYEDGELNRYAKEQNWKVSEKIMTKKNQKEPFITEIDIPWTFGTTYRYFL